jgi:long-subunit fatty acid transport protein
MRILLVGLVLPVLLAPSAASAQVGFRFNRPGSGARAAGMANAFIAVSDDGTAASWNPAGLGQLRKPELSLVGTALTQTVATRGFRSRDDSSVFSPTTSSHGSSYVDFASLAVPLTLFGKPLTFQAAWRRLYALDFRENVSLTREPLAGGAPPPAQISANSDVVGSVDLLSFAGAVKLTPRLALGVSANGWQGDWWEERAVSEALLNGASPSEFVRVRQDNRVRGWNATAGLLLTYPRWSVGLVYQSPLASDYRTTARGETSTHPPPPAQEVEGTIHFARALGLGGAWRPSARYMLALDLTWDDWSGTLLDTPVTGKVNFFDGLPEERTSTRDTLSLNVGAERLFVGEAFVVPLRFGVALEPQGGRSPYTLDPVDFVMLALGSGYNTNSLKFDAALQYRWATFRDGASFSLGSLPYDPLLPEAVGERRVKEWRVKLSLIFRITNTEKLRRTLRGVFAGEAADPKDGSS